MTTTPRQSKPLKWHGGKSYLAKWILGHFPPRESYTHYNEAYAGGLSVLFGHDPTGKSEAVNDLNKSLSDFWFVLARAPERMISELLTTPLSESFWRDAKHEMVDGDMVSRAVAFFVRYRQSRQGLGKDYATPTPSHAQRDARKRIRLVVGGRWAPRSSRKVAPCGSPQHGRH